MIYYPVHLLLVNSSKHIFISVEYYAIVDKNTEALVTFGHEKKLFRCLKISQNALRNYWTKTVGH